MDDDYVVEGYWVDGYVYSYQEPLVPDWYQTPINQILPSYLYQQYDPDPNVWAFFAAYNDLSQKSLDYLISLNLPIWTSDTITGILLDWVALGLYGFNRPVLTFGSVALSEGVYNANTYDVFPYNSAIISGNSGISIATDDIFKRCLTWNLYKGDGFQFNVFWLKKRVIRFLSGSNGVAPRIDNTYNVSIAYGTNNNVIITVKSFYAADVVQVLQAAIVSGAVQLPVQYNFSLVY